MSQKAVAVLPVKLEAADGVRQALGQLVQAVRAFESAAAPGTFLLVGEWQDQAGFDTHLASEHVQGAVAGTAEALAGDLGIHPLQPV